MNEWWLPKTHAALLLTGSVQRILFRGLCLQVHSWAVSLVFLGRIFLVEGAELKSGLAAHMNESN